MVSHLAMLQALYGADTGGGSGGNVTPAAPAQHSKPQSIAASSSPSGGSTPHINLVRGPPAFVYQIDPLLSSRQVANACGPVSMTTLWRWHRDLTVSFPDPDALIYHRRYWRLSTVNRWLAERAASAKAHPNEGRR